MKIQWFEGPELEHEVQMVFGQKVVGLTYECRRPNSITLELPEAITYLGTHSGGQLRDYLGHLDQAMRR